MIETRDVGEHLFVSTRTVTSLIERGIIKREPVIGFNLDAVRKDYIEHLRSLAGKKSGSPGADLNLTNERARLAREQADRIAMDNEISRKTLIPADLIKKAGENLFVAMRAKILASNLLDSEKDDLLNDLRSLSTNEWA